MKFLLYWFIGLYPFLIYPWGKNYYYANGKAYYFLGAMLFLGILCWSRMGRDRLIFVKRVTFLEWMLFIFLVLVGCSTVHAVKPSLVGDLTEHQGILMMMAYVILFIFASRRGSLKWQRSILQLILFSSFFAALYGVLQHAHLAFLPQDARMNFGTRTFSFFDNPDYFGAYLVLMLMAAMTSFLAENVKWRGILQLLILCTLSLSLLQSETRSAWLGGFVGFCILTIFVVGKRKELWKKWGIMLLTFLFIFGWTNAASHHSYAKRAVTIAHDAQKIAVNKDSGAAGASRWYIWQTSIPLIEKYFWLGSGPNTFQYVYHPENEQQNKKYLGSGPIYDENNDYLQIALTMGVPALLVYLLFLSIVIRSGFKKARNLSGDQQIYTYGLLAAIIGYLVQAFFNISVVSVAPYFWLFLGLVMNGCLSPSEICRMR